MMLNSARTSTIVKLMHVFAHAIRDACMLALLRACMILLSAIALSCKCLPTHKCEVYFISATALSVTCMRILTATRKKYNSLHMHVVVHVEQQSLGRLTLARLTAADL